MSNNEPTIVQVMHDLRQALGESYSVNRLVHASYEEMIAMVAEIARRERQGRRLRGDVQRALNKISAEVEDEL